MLGSKLYQACNLADRTWSGNDCREELVVPAIKAPIACIAIEVLVVTKEEHLRTNVEKESSEL